MVLKKHEDKPWEWVDNKCTPQMGGIPECDGVMELKNVYLKTPISESLVNQYLEKIWVCNKCGFVFAE